MSNRMFNEYFTVEQLERILWKRFKSRQEAVRAFNAYAKTSHVVWEIDSEGIAFMTVNRGRSYNEIKFEEEPNPTPGKPAVWRLRVV